MPSPWRSRSSAQTPASHSPSGRHGEPCSSPRRPSASRALSTRPSRVKQAVCGYGRADKAAGGEMVKAILALDEVPTPNHAADALAVAICHALAPPLLRDGRVVIARLRGRSPAAAGRGLIVDVNGVGYLVSATPSVAAARRRRGSTIEIAHRRPRGRAAALRLRDGRRARALRAAARRLRRRAEGRARDRLRLDAGRAAPRDRARRREALPGDPRRRPEDGAARRARAEGEARRSADGAGPGGRGDLTARDALVELGWTLVDAERALAERRPDAAGRGAGARRRCRAAA